MALHCSIVTIKPLPPHITMEVYVLGNVASGKSTFIRRFVFCGLWTLDTRISSGHRTPQPYFSKVSESYEGVNLLGEFITGRISSFEFHTHQLAIKDAVIRRSRVENPHGIRVYERTPYCHIGAFAKIVREHGLMNKLQMNTLQYLCSNWLASLPKNQPLVFVYLKNDSSNSARHFHERSLKEPNKDHSFIPEELEKAPHFFSIDTYLCSLGANQAQVFDQLVELIPRGHFVTVHVGDRITLKQERAVADYISAVQSGVSVDQKIHVPIDVADNASIYYRTNIFLDLQRL